jgi:hypothetical protein
LNSLLFSSKYKGGSDENSESEKVGRNMKSYLNAKITVLVGYFTIVGTPGHVEFVDK